MVNLNRSLFLLLLLLVACNRGQEVAPPEIAVPQNLLENSQAEQRGEALFHQHCRECHGSLAEGRNPRAERFVPPAPDFKNPEYAHMDPAYLFWRIRDGKNVEPFRSKGSVMPAWGPYLSEEQIWQLVAYLRQRPVVQGE